MTDLPIPVIAIPLGAAAMCLSCEHIFWLPGSNWCPKCADEHFVMLEKIVGTVLESGKEKADTGMPAQKEGAR